MHFSPKSSYLRHLTLLTATEICLCYTLGFSQCTSTPDGFSLVADAFSSGGGCIVLTTATNNKRGCAWYDYSKLDFNAAFSHDFTVNLGNIDGGGADGIAFVIQNDSRGTCACGQAGGSLAYGGPSGTAIDKSVAIEIDTWNNGSSYGDVSSDHLDIHINGNIYSSVVTGGSVGLTNGGSPYNVENGLDHILRIAWSPNLPTPYGTLTATLMNAAATTGYGSVSYYFNPNAVFNTMKPNFGFTASTGGAVNQQTFCVPITLLPVELISFEGINKNKQIQLQWATASETNNQQFIIERSTDGVHFQQIATVPGSGNSNMPLHYEWTDTRPEPTTNYYRLSQTTFNGFTGFHKTIAVQYKSDVQIKISQVAQETLAVDVFQAEQEEQVLLQLHDLCGSLVSTTSLLVTPSNNLHQTIDIRQLPKGIYVISLIGRNTMVHTKIFIG